MLVHPPPLSPYKCISPCPLAQVIPVGLLPRLQLLVTLDLSSNCLESLPSDIGALQ